MAIEDSLRREIAELRQTITSFATTVTRLDVTLTKELEAANTRINNLERLMTELVEKLAEPRQVIPQESINRIFYALLGVGGILIVIAWQIANGGGV